MASFVVYHFTTVEGGTYVGRTVDFPRRLGEHKRVHRITETKILGEYPDIKIKGYGRLCPRMEYMWYIRLEPTINKLVPGLHYYQRDLRRYEGADPFGAYEELDDRLRQTVGGEVTRKCPEMVRVGFAKLRAAECPESVPFHEGIDVPKGSVPSLVGNCTPYGVRPVLRSSKTSGESVFSA